MGLRALSGQGQWLKALPLGHRDLDLYLHAAVGKVNLSKFLLLHLQN